MRLVSQQPVKGSGRYPQGRNRGFPADPQPGHPLPRCGVRRGRDSVEFAATSAAGMGKGRGMTTTAPADEWYRKRYRDLVAMNLRLPEELASALRELSEQTGRSQQELAREALEEFVRDYRLRAYPKEVRHLVSPSAGGSWADAILLDPPLPEGTDVQQLLEEQRQERY